jgi:hypothetical protein
VVFFLEVILIYVQKTYSTLFLLCFLSIPCAPVFQSGSIVEGGVNSKAIAIGQLDRRTKKYRNILRSSCVYICNLFISSVLFSIVYLSPLLCCFASLTYV